MISGEDIVGMNVQRTICLFSVIGIDYWYNARSSTRKYLTNAGWG